MQRVQRVNYKDLRKLKPVKTAGDIVRGLLAQPQGVYAQWRGKHPVTGKWQSVGLGRVPTKDELEDFIADWSEEIHNATGENPVTLLVDLDYALDRFREKADALNKRLRAGLDPRSEAGPEGITLRQALALHAQRMRNLGKSEATIPEYEWLAKRYLKDWLDVPLRKLTDAMVSKYIKRRGDSRRSPSPICRHGSKRLRRCVRAAWQRCGLTSTYLRCSPACGGGASPRLSANTSTGAYPTAFISPSRGAVRIEPSTCPFRTRPRPSFSAF
jgi:hypothetical protein